MILLLEQAFVESYVKISEMKTRTSAAAPDKEWQQCSPHLDNRNPQREVLAFSLTRADVLSDHRRLPAMRLSCAADTDRRTRFVFLRSAVVE